MHELARSRPVNTNELFDAATNFAAGEEAVGAIFDDKPSKRKDDAPAEGSNVKPNAPAKKQKRGKKGKKLAPTNQRGSGQAEDSEEAFAAVPDRKGPRGPLEVVAAYSTTCSRSRALPQGLGQPHPRAVRDAQEVQQSRRAPRRG